jgi:ATP-dependent Clp protease protease subunit
MFYRLVTALRLFEGQDCTVIINSYGGEVVQLLAMLEAIEFYPGKVRTHATGACMSAAAILLQSGDVRSMTPDCTVMLHFGSEQNDSGAEAAHNAKINKRIKEYLRVATGRSPKTINKWLAADTFFTAPEAKKANLIDEVTT